MHDDINELSLEELHERLAGTGLPRRAFELARDEDLGTQGDLTSEAWFEHDATLRASIAFREAGVVCGLAFIDEICEVFTEALQSRVAVDIHIPDGSCVEKGAAVATLTGARSGVVGVERTILNTVGRLSGIATLTAKFVEEAGNGGKQAGVLDTRKTTPGLRVLEKYAVRCGGGLNHRLGLHDAVLVKDNHIAGLTDGELRERAESASRVGRELGASFIEIEVDRLEQLDALLELEPGTVDIVLLDNMRNDLLREAVAKRDAKNPELLLEASGNVRLETIAGIAQSGVDRISAGALTHSSIWIDVGLDAIDG